MAYTKYSLTPANNTATPPDGAPEGMLPSAVNDTMRDMMAQIRDCGDGIRDGTYTMTAPKITGGTITGATFTGNTFTSPIISGGSLSGTTFTSGTITGSSITAADNAFTLQDNADATKQAVFELSGITTATTRTYTLPNLTGSLATIGNLAQTFSGSSTFSNTFTLSGTTQNIALGTSQTTGTLTAGGAAQTGTITLDQSTKAHTLNIGSGATENATTKTINIGANGVSGSTTAITIGSANGTTTTLNGTAVFAAGAVGTPSITTSGDTNTGIFFPAADTIAFSEGGSEVVRINSSANVGIGTTTPATKLDVNGTITATSVNTNNTFGFKNRIINGAMVIDQRNAGASVSVAAGDATWDVDRWMGSSSQASKFTLQQSTVVPAGFKNSMVATVSSTITVGANDYAGILQRVEGLNVYDFDWGTANAKTVTLSFWVRSSVTGTYCISIRNSADNRSYVSTYTISSANTWEQKSITIAGDTSGTWLTTNGLGMAVYFTLSSGSTYGSATANAWSSSLGIATSSQTQWIQNSGATFYITGVQLEVGSTATSFDYRPYGTELDLCQRYYERMTVLYYTTAWAAIALPAPYKVQKRASPTVTNTPDGGTGGVYATYLATNLTAGTDVVFQTVANTTATGGSIQLSAEL